MKAITFKKYGPPSVLQLEDLPVPEPKKGEVQIKVMAATVTAGDCELRRFDIKPTWWLFVRFAMGLFKPRVNVLGQELAGIVTKSGPEAKRFKPGDRVFSACDMSMGAYAEYNCLKEEPSMTLTPEDLSFAEAATIPTGGLNALYFLNKAEVKPGDKVLINGAGGSIGTYGVQLARLMGAEVTAVDSGIKLTMLQSIGADHVIDFEKEDFTQAEMKYDVIFDVAAKTSLSSMLRVLKKGGRLMDSNPSFSGLILAIFVNLLSSKKLRPGLATYCRENCEYLADLMAKRKIKAVIDKEFDLEDLREAHEYVEKGLKKGNVSISIGPPIA